MSNGWAIPLIKSLLRVITSKNSWDMLQNLSKKAMLMSVIAQKMKSNKKGDSRNKILTETETYNNL